jgi:PBSX family phage terminase large subunit
MNLQLDASLFNPLFFKYLNSKADKVVSYGGSGSGKSYSMLQYIIYTCLQNPEENFLCIRKNYVDTKDSIFDILITIIKQWGLIKNVKINLSDRKIRFQNGAQIFMKGLDDVENLKSLAPTNIFIEEATQIELADYQQIELRLRGENARNGKIWLLFNPISKNNFIYHRFFGDGVLEDESVDIFKTTWRNNKFLTKKDIRTINNYKKLDYNMYRIYSLGDWGNTSMDGIFYHDFNNKSITDCVYNPNMPLHISLDENSVPYCSLIISQIYQFNDKSIVKIIKTYGLYGKNIYYVLERFKSDYSEHEAGLFIYGDSTSQKKSVFLEQDQNFYSIVMDNLKRYNPVKRVLPSNQFVTTSRLYMNKIFRNDSDISILIDPTCKELIDDLENTKVDINGGKDKKIINDKLRGMKYQEHGHMTDALSYLIIQAFFQDFIKFKTGSMLDFKLSGGKRREVGY